MLTNLQPAIAANRPLGGFGAGAVLCEGNGTGSFAIPSPAQALPRVRRVSWAAAGFGGYSGIGMSTSQQINPKHTTLIDPAYRGTLGPHPAREPEPA